MMALISSTKVIDVVIRLLEGNWIVLIRRLSRRVLIIAVVAIKTASLIIVDKLRVTTDVIEHLFVPILWA